MTKIETVEIKSRATKYAGKSSPLGISELLADAIAADGAADLTLCGNCNCACDTGGNWA